MINDTSLAVELSRIAHESVVDGKMRHDVGLLLIAAVREHRATTEPCRDEKAKADRDLMLYGESLMFDGMHIPLDKVEWRRAAGVTTRSDAQADERGAFQAHVHPWMLACFGAAIAADTVERNHRFFEEAAELVQSCGMTASEAHQLVDYTWSRPVGEKTQELGGVMVTLAALCLANGLNMHAAGEIELARISAPETMAKIRAKQAAKPKHSPLPEAHAAAPQAQGVASAVDLQGLREKLLAPREIVRDEDGWLTHPDFPICDEDVHAGKLLEAIRIESAFVSMEDDVSAEAYEEYHESESPYCSSWTPTPPTGNGWVLIEIYDTEDGPYALFGRDAYAAEQERKKEHTRKLRADMERVRAERAAGPSREHVGETDRRPATSHCQNGGDVCLAGNRDGVCCPEDSCDIDDGVRKAQEASPSLECGVSRPVGYMNIRGLTQLANGGYAIINPEPTGDATHAVYSDVRECGERQLSDEQRDTLAVLCHPQFDRKLTVTDKARLRGILAASAPTPSAPTHDEISALLLDYAKACNESSSATRMNEARDAIMMAFRRALSSAPTASAQGAPVAIVESWTNGSYHRNYNLRWMKDVEPGTKLYKTPQPAPAVAKEGMTEEQRGAIETALSLIGLSGDPRVRNVHKVLRALLGAKGK